MKMKAWAVAAAALFYSHLAMSQDHRKCGNDVALERVMAEHPELRNIPEQQSAKRIEWLTNTAKQGAQKPTATVTVPVIFHIVLNPTQLSSIGGATGVALRVDSQMAVLNRDFNGMALDQAQIPGVFKPLYGNAQIQFGLAHTAPDGSATPGYEIITTTQSGFSVQTGSTGSTYFASDAKYASSGGANGWDGFKYLNIWIINFSESGLLGVCPPISYYIQGIVPLNETGAAINYRTFGKTGPGQLVFLNGYNGGRTLVHELGHYFELNHIWGNTQIGAGNCNDDDGIADTPRQQDANDNCPTFPKANCTNTTGGEMFMNYMDYVYDACYKMFTTQQAAVMNADVATPTGYAYPLTQNPHLLQYPTSVPYVKNENALIIFPNPTTNGQFQISITDKDDLEKIVVTNVLGQQVKNIVVADKQLKNHNIDLSGVTKGVYTVQCIFAGGQLTKKIILQ
ncbi:MAG TPA: zinc-dependent metalloprotease [Flavipsychrobacter sp.]|nr:zinc-dependent metalloprotease [Flavipsychrobacter sp.]